MIPTVEQILSDLLNGSITREKATAWIHEHLRLAEESSMESMRDGLAAAALQGLIARDGDDSAYGSDMVRGRPILAYEYADAMLKARAA